MLRLPKYRLLALYALSIWLITSCKTPAPTDLKRQKFLQVAVLLSYAHPSAYRNVKEGLQRAMDELSQVNAVIFGQAAEPKLSRRERVQAERTLRREQQLRQGQTPGFGTSSENLKTNYLAHIAWKKQQFRQIITGGYDVLVFFGDELPDMDESLRQARQAGLFVIYCGFASKPIHSQSPLTNRRNERHLRAYKNSQSPDNYPYTRSTPDSILSENADRGQRLDQDHQGNPIDGGGTPLPYADQTGLNIATKPRSAPVPPAALRQTRQETDKRGFVDLNIRPTSLGALLRSLTQFLTGTSAPAGSGNNEKGEVRLNTSARHQPAALVLFGSSQAPFTRVIYRQMRDNISRNRDYIQAVRFLNPLRIDSQEELRRLAINLGANGRIVALEPLLLYSSAQVLQRYGLGLKLAGLGWKDLSDPLIASGNIQLLVPLQYGALAYAALYAAFALYSGEKQGKSGENFLLGSYGQRQVGTDGSLVINSFYGVTQPQSIAPVQMGPQK